MEMLVADWTTRL